MVRGKKKGIARLDPTDLFYGVWTCVLEDLQMYL